MEAFVSYWSKTDTSPIVMNDEWVNCNTGKNSNQGNHVSSGKQKNKPRIRLDRENRHTCMTKITHTKKHK